MSDFEEKYDYQEIMVEDISQIYQIANDYNSFYDTFIALSLFSSSCVTLFVGIAISNPFTNRIVLCIT